MRKITPDYKYGFGWWELYSSDIMTEYRQSIEEGKDIEKYKELFEAISKMDKSEYKEEICDTVFNLVLNAEQRQDFKYVEPSDLNGIKKLRKLHKIPKVRLSQKSLKSKISGAWYGRICGCLLGKPIESVWKEDIWEILKRTNNYPLERYISASEIPDDIFERLGWIKNRCFIDRVNGFAPFDDDTNYMVLAQEVIKKFGRDFTPFHMSRAWLDFQPKESYCTAERIAFRNFVRGILPPQSAEYKNVYREWIGAQIRGDYFGYINPQKPEIAADMAFRDACISHTKNGIYGEMWASAMIACAFSTSNMEDIIRGGLGQIPKTSRLYEAIENVIDWHNSGLSSDEVFNKIYERFNDKDGHDWCHTISNAMIVATALLYGEGDYSKTICMAVQAGFDTDCNGATVGSIVGITNGVEGIDKKWTDPICNTLQTTIFGIDKVKISDCVKKTIEHIK